MSDVKPSGCFWEGKKVREDHEWYLDGSSGFVCRQCGKRQRRVSDRKPKDRKTEIEWTLIEANKINGHLESGLAWQRLCNELTAMCEPEARPPRFNSVLRAIWVAATNEQS